ncbi:MAG: hypothetical protein HOO00_03270 [Rhodospirillaceae bacterium]|nr:hypothetical protein [Rhodospirillaceae bacterium]
MESLARRFLDLWEDQLAAMAADPDQAEALSRMIAMSSPTAAGFPQSMSDAMRIFQQGFTQNSDHTQTQPSQETPPGPAGAAPAAPPSGGSGDELGELTARISALEKQLADLVAEPSEKSRKPKKTARKRRS